jgi:ATP-dependent protease ClpP protease subunit
MYKQWCLFFIIGVFMIRVFLCLALLTGTVFAKQTEIVLTEENSVNFNQPVTGEYTAKKSIEIFKKSLKAKELYLVLDTPGGSVMAGLQFIDIIKSLNIKVHTITIFAASMGYQIVQELGTRYILSSGSLMSHRGSVSGMSGQVPGELNSRLNFIQSLLSKMSESASKRVGMSKSDYEAAIVNELWTFGQSAVDSRHADEVASVRCGDNLLNKTRSEVVSTIFGDAVVTYSACPLVSAPISVEPVNGVKAELAPLIKDQIKAKNKKTNLSF